MKTKNHKNNYVAPKCSVCYIHDKNSGIMATSVNENITDSDEEFHNGAKEFTFDEAVGFNNEFWTVDMNKNHEYIDGDITSYNILIK